MKVLGRRSIASFVKRVLDSLWWLISAAIALLTVLLLCSFLLDFRGNNLTLSLPVALQFDTAVHGVNSSLQTDAQIEKVRGNLKFPVRRNAFVSVSVSLILLMTAFLLWVVGQLRHVFRSLSAGVPFAADNARRIRWVGIAIIVGEVARSVIVFSWSAYLSQHFTANGLNFVAIADFNISVVLSGLVILVISEVFREGTRLQEEQSLTI